MRQFAQKTLISNNVNQECKSSVISSTALEALETRRNRYGKRGLGIWDDASAQTTDAKKHAYLKHLCLKIDHTRPEYKLRCCIARRKIYKIKRNRWNKYIDIESDVQGRQDKTYKILWRLDQTERDKLKVSNGADIMIGCGPRSNWKNKIWRHK